MSSRADEGQATAESESARGVRAAVGAGRWGVPLAAVGLVGAVWIALALSRRAPGEDAAAPVVPPSATPSVLAGFRADAWYLPDDELLGFVLIPAGPFVMGSDPAADPLAFDVERWSATARQGSPELADFYIGRFEVTVAQFAAFVRATGHSVDPQALAGAPDHPVVAVSWPDALAYARWLDGTLRASAAAPQGVRDVLARGWSVGLPTEAQWEKAARGDDGRIYPWGDDPRRDRANYRARSTTRVGSFDCPECPYGLSDMSGNVWEWTRSPYQPYPYDPADDTADLEADALWVMRGGGFGDGEQNVRAANRGGADPGARRPFIGFRLVISPE